MLAKNMVPSETGGEVSSGETPLAESVMVKASVRWEFEEHSSVWTPLSPEDSDVLEACWKNDKYGRHKLRLGPRRFQYNVDFKKARQQNLKTKRKRALRRVVAW